MGHLHHLFGWAFVLAVLGSTACQAKPQPLVIGQRLDLNLTVSDPQPAFLFHMQGNGVGVIPVDALYDFIGNTPEEIAYVTLDGTWKQLELERKFPCDYAVYYSQFRRLPDGRLALLGYCSQIAPGQAASYLLAHDDATHTTTFLIPSALPIDDTGLFAWNPSVDRAVVSFGTLFSGLYWVDAAGAQPVTGTVQAYGKSFSLDTAYVGFSRNASGDTGNATSPDWSPDGSTIAFLASIDSINRQGIDRIEGRWLLCLMDIQTLEPKVVVKDIYHRGGLQWSFDGRFIAFNGQVGAMGTQGLWLYSVSDGKVQLIAEGSFSDFIWATDDTAIYGILYKDDNIYETEVWQYDMRDIVMPLATPIP